MGGGLWSSGQGKVEEQSGQCALLRYDRVSDGTVLGGQSFLMQLTCGSRRASRHRAYLMPTRRGGSRCHRNRRRIRHKQLGGPGPQVRRVYYYPCNSLPICGIKPFVTQMSHILTQRAVRFIRYSTHTEYGCFTGTSILTVLFVTNIIIIGSAMLLGCRFDLSCLELGTQCKR